MQGDSHEKDVESPSAAVVTFLLAGSFHSYYLMPSFLHCPSTVAANYQPWAAHAQHCLSYQHTKMGVASSLLFQSEQRMSDKESSVFPRRPHPDTPSEYISRRPPLESVGNLLRGTVEPSCCKIKEHIRNLFTASIVANFGVRG